MTITVKDLVAILSDFEDDTEVVIVDKDDVKGDFVEVFAVSGGEVVCQFDFTTAMTRLKIAIV